MTATSRLTYDSLARLTEIALPKWRNLQTGLDYLERAVAMKKAMVAVLLSISLMASVSCSNEVITAQEDPSAVSFVDMMRQGDGSPVSSGQGYRLSVFALINPRGIWIT